MAAKGALTLGVVRPDAGLGDAGQVGPHHHLRSQRLALAGFDDVRIRHAEDVVGHHGRRLGEPVVADLLQDLALERQRADHAVEGANAIGGDEVAPPVLRHVALAHLADGASAQRLERRPLERLV